MAPVEPEPRHCKRLDEHDAHSWDAKDWLGNDLHCWCDGRSLTTSDPTPDEHLAHMAESLRKFGDELAAAFKPIAAVLGKALKDCYDALKDAHDRDPNGFHAAMWDPTECPFDEEAS